MVHDSSTAQDILESVIDLATEDNGEATQAQWYPGMRQDCARAALELRAILEKALSGTYTLPPNCSPPTRTPNPMCRNFTVADCVEASICPEFLLEATPKQLAVVARQRRNPQTTCAHGCGNPLATARSASALDVPVIRSGRQVA